MSSVASIGLSGMRAAEALASAAAANIVHAGAQGRIAGPDVAPADAAFQQVTVVTYDLGSDGGASGVGYSPPTKSASSTPAQPIAVATPSVNVPAELVSLAQAKYQFYSSVAVVWVGDEMMRAVINLVA